MKSKYEKVSDYLFAKLLSEKTRRIGEKIIVLVAIASFLLHLTLIALVYGNILQVNDYSNFLNNPIAAIYTPFSFILIYEVYLLVYYLPKSTTSYIGKQYEIIALVVIRRLFKDLSQLELTEDWFNVKNDLQFTYDLIATLLLFFLIYAFYRLNQKNTSSLTPPLYITRFIQLKTWIAVFLIPILIILATYSFVKWFYENFISLTQMVDSIKDVNKIFFDEFFTVLILTDVLLLLVSLLYTDKFNKVIRNSGFIISTVLLKLSFGVDGLLNTLLIIVAVSFGVIILWIHNLYEKINFSE